MASKVEGLECPMCLDAFMDPTILSCGHTFCKGCLEKYDEQHHLDHIVCPVCRKSTKLGENRVSGLTPNFSLKGLEVRLQANVATRSTHFCSLHNEVYEDIFCEDCGEFMCITCYFDNHRYHTFKKKEELEGYLKKKIETLIQNSKTRKTQIEKSVNNAEKQRVDIHRHFDNVEKAIKNELAKRVTILQKTEGTLIKKLDYIRKDTENQLEGCIAKYKKVIDSINWSTLALRGYTGKNLDSDTIKAHNLQCSDLEKLLKKIIDKESMDRLKQTAESTQFFPADEKLLALGHIDLGIKETMSNIQRVKTAAAGTNKKAEQVKTCRKVAVIPALVGSKSLNIVRKVDAPAVISGISALSHDTVVVGYGVFRHGSDCFSSTGEKTQHLKSGVGMVFDIAVLTDGRSVVSHGSDTMCVYSSQNAWSESMKYSCKNGDFKTTLSSDQYNDIYDVNGNPEIYIFRGSNPNPQRVVPTGDIRPRQICVTKTGVMITSTCNTTPSTVTVFDREGHVGSSITASDDNEQLYAAVDSQDRVLVAQVTGRSDVFRLTRYTLEGTTLIQQMTFNDLTLHHQLYSYYYMASLSPNMPGLARYDHLYFMQLSV